MFTKKESKKSRLHKIPPPQWRVQPALTRVRGDLFGNILNINSLIVTYFEIFTDSGHCCQSEN